MTLFWHGSTQIGRPSPKLFCLHSKEWTNSQDGQIDSQDGQPRRTARTDSQDGQPGRTARTYSQDEQPGRTARMDSRRTAGGGQRGRTAGADSRREWRAGRTCCTSLRARELAAPSTEEATDSCQRESKLLQKLLSIRWVRGKGEGDALEAGNKSGRGSLSQK